MAGKAADVAVESVGLFKKGQKALLDRLQKMVDDGATKADLDKVAGNAAKIKPGPGAIETLKKTEARFIDWVTRQKRFKTGGAYKSGGKGVDGKKTGAVPQAAKDIRVKRGVARTIVYGGGATALGTAGNATSNSNNTSSGDATLGTLTAAEKKAARLKKLKEGQAKVNATNPGSPGNEIKKGKLFPKFRPFGGVIARALLGDDEKFGGERGLIDFIRLKKKKNKTPAEKEKIKAGEAAEAAKKKAKAAATKAAAASKKASGLKNGGMAKKPVKKNMGGMMKKKGYSKGGAMKKKGYAMGGMTKKGYANGGMAKKGYANGGPAKKTTAKKTSSRGKARGVGAATRGYGATMR